jgi:hypothetical protein
MVVDQILGRFGWYRRHRGGLWTHIPGAGGGYFHQPSARDERPEWAISLANISSSCSRVWHGRLATRLRDRLTHS